MPSSEHERNLTDEMVADAAKMKSYDQGFIRYVYPPELDSPESPFLCFTLGFLTLLFHRKGMHGETPTRLTPLCVIRCEKHITAKFCINGEEMYVAGVVAHIYTDGKKITRVEWYQKRKG